MTYYCSFTNQSLSPFFGHKIKRNLRKVLEENGFKKKFCLVPSTRKYVASVEVSAQIKSGTKQDSGSKEHGIKPYEYYFVGLEMDGPKDNEIFEKTSRELRAYWNKVHNIEN